MAIGRCLEYADGFARNLQYFTKRKDPGLTERVHKALTSRLEQGPLDSDRCLSGFQSLPLFKMRIPAQGRGKRGGARVVYYCDQESLLPLLIYVKSEKADMGPADRKQIKSALQNAGLWPQ